MRITATGQTTVAATARKRGAQRAGGSFDGLLEEEATSGPTATQSAIPLSPVSGLLALQETRDAAAGRSKGLARAEDMLEQLEGIRRGLILGAIPASQLQNLAASLRDRRLMTGDERLQGLLDEVELRAAVELAKLGIYLNS
ncbi:MAG: flagellar assembly protein FliX [Sphingomonadales bacterium]|nr:flagellar assembly protein FliX [Sphingomonadales bacterium]